MVSINGMKLTDNERKALTAWSGCSIGAGFGFRVIEKRSGLEGYLIRRTVRQLARKGIVQFEQSLWTKDGDMLGAGYTLTESGYAALKS